MAGHGSGEEQHPSKATSIDKRDFEESRPLVSNDTRVEGEDDRDRHYSRRVQGQGEDEDEGLLDDVASEIVKRDREDMKRETVKLVGFLWGLLSAYVSMTLSSLFLPSHRQTGLQVG